MRPHEVFGKVADGVANGVRGVGNGLVGTLKGLGSNVQSALDTPFKMVAPGREGPHRAADRLINGTVDAAVNAVDTGAMGSLQKEGAAIMRTLDQPAEATGMPPDIDLGRSMPFGKK